LICYLIRKTTAVSILLLWTAANSGFGSLVFFAICFARAAVSGPTKKPPLKPINSNTANS